MTHRKAPSTQGLYRVAGGGWVAVRQEETSTRSACKGAGAKRSWCWPTAPFAHLQDLESTRPSFNWARYDPRSTTGWTSCQWLHTGAAASRSMSWRLTRCWFSGSHAQTQFVLTGGNHAQKLIWIKEAHRMTKIAAAPLEPFHCSQPTNKIMMQ